MLYKKVLYGIGIGLLGPKIYPQVKKNIKPIVKKFVKNVIIISINTKSFINQVIKEIEPEKKNKIYTFEIKKDTNDELKLLGEEQRRAFSKITELKKQLEDVSKKIDNL
jgi:hypothetical protein